MSATSAAILGRVIEPDVPDWSADVARALLRLDFPPRDHARVEELSAKASDGMLEAHEREELEEYLRVSDMVAIIQSKARMILQRSGATA